MSQALARKIRDKAREAAYRARNVHRGRVLDTNPLEVELFADERILREPEMTQNVKVYDAAYGIDKGDAVLLMREHGEWTIFDVITDESAGSESVVSVAGKTGVVTLVKADVGLGSVDNTADANKPVSTAQQAALNAKLAAALVDAKGDLIVGTAADAVARKAVGSGVLTPDPGQADGLRWAEILPPSLIAALDPRLASSLAVIGAANEAQLVRVVVPKTGNLRDLAVYVGTSSGNVDVGVYDCQATRNRLWSSGSVACPAGGAWRKIGDPDLPVVAGQHLELALACDNATATFARTLNIAAALNTLPTDYWPTNGAAPKLASSKTASFPLPATFAEADLAASVSRAIIGRIS